LDLILSLASIVPSFMADVKAESRSTIEDSPLKSFGKGVASDVVGGLVPQSGNDVLMDMILDATTGGPGGAALAALIPPGVFKKLISGGKRQAKATVREGMQHTVGGASVENMSRPDQFFEISRSGKVTRILEGGEDAGATYKGSGAVVRVGPQGQLTPEGGHLANKAMQDAAEAVEIGPQISRGVDEVTELSEIIDDDTRKFLEELGVTGVENL